MTITAAADGSALGNPGPAGWAWYVDDDRWASGGWPRGTNNMGELMAVLDLLRQTAHVSDDLLVYCDSLYVINTVTQWMAGWKRRGWRKKDGKPVLNLDLVRALDEAVSGRPVRFEWVKGHAGHPLNEAADRLAVAASTAFREGREPDAGPGYPGAAATADVLPAEEALVEDLFSGTEDGQTVDARPDDDPARDPDPQAVVALERLLLGDAVRGEPDAVAALLDPSFTEFGASGRRWTRQQLLASVGPIEGGAELEVLDLQRLGTDTVLLLWRSTTEAGSSLRSSLWVFSRGRWRQRFAQGTPERVQAGGSRTP